MFLCVNLWVSISISRTCWLRLAGFEVVVVPLTTNVVMVGGGRPDECFRLLAKCTPAQTKTRTSRVSCGSRLEFDLGKRPKRRDGQSMLASYQDLRLLPRAKSSVEVQKGIGAPVESLDVLE